MITFVRTGAVAPGKFAGAIAYAQKIVAYWRDHYDLEIAVHRPVAGNPNRLSFVGRYKDLAEFDSVVAKTLADTKFSSSRPAAPTCSSPDRSTTRFGGASSRAPPARDGDPARPPAYSGARSR